MSSCTFWCKFIDLVDFFWLLLFDPCHCDRGQIHGVTKNTLSRLCKEAIYTYIYIFKSRSKCNPRLIKNASE